MFQLKAKFTMPVIHKLYIHLGAKEYGNELMREVALEQLQKYPAEANLVVHVTEHGGWFLAWTLIDGQMVVVDTANDGAILSPAAKQFWETHRTSEVKMLETIRRS